MLKYELLKFNKRFIKKIMENNGSNLICLQSEIFIHPEKCHKKRRV